MAELTGKVAMVTGAGSGVGRTVSLRLAESGVTVGLFGRRVEPLQQVASEIERAGGKSHIFPGDLADEQSVTESIDQFITQAGGLHILIHCAGVGIYGPVERYGLEDWNQTFASNLTSLFLCTRAALPYLRAQESGQIIAIASGAARRGYANLAAYSASKFGLIGFMESLAEEVGSDGIKCATILPGSIMTEFGPTSLEEKQASAGTRKFLQPDDVADTILHLLHQPPHAWTQEVNLWPF